MGAKTKIEWTSSFNPKTGKWEPGATWNPWIGCTPVQPGCDHCYADALATRYGWATWGPGQPRHRTSAANWRKPLAWDKEARAGGYRIKVFCASLADVFDQEVSDEWRTDLFRVIEQTTNTDWLLLTKRSGAVWKYINWVDWSKVWLGTSIDDNKWAFRSHEITRVPAKLYWVSYEPALGPLDLDKLHPDIKWVVVGGESGPCARTFDVRWALDLIEQARERNIAVFFKQLGSNPCISSKEMGTVYYFQTKDSKGSDWSEWNPEWRVREFPDGTAIDYEGGERAK